MRRMLLLVLSLSFALSACMPAFVQQALNPTPTIDALASTTAFEATISAQTAIAMAASATLPPTETPVIVVASNTSLPTSAPTETLAVSGTPPTSTVTITGTLPTITMTPSGTAFTATASPTNVTGTPGTPVAGASATITPTMGVRYYGTIPPLVPSGKIVMFNKSHSEVYISFQCINQEGTLSILEYPVPRWREERIPSGKCKYVAWVGGREFTGSFTLDTGGQKKILFYKDRVGIN